MPRKRLVKLEKGTVSGVWVDEKYGVRKILGQPIRVRHGNHHVVDAIDDKRGLADASEMFEASLRRPAPTPGRPPSVRRRPPVRMRCRNLLSVVQASR
jgi:hypothetical protein